MEVYTLECRGVVNIREARARKQLVLNLIPSAEGRSEARREVNQQSRGMLQPFPLHRLVHSEEGMMCALYPSQGRAGKLQQPQAAARAVSRRGLVHSVSCRVHAGIWALQTFAKA